MLARKNLRVGYGVSAPRVEAHQLRRPRCSRSSARQWLAFVREPTNAYDPRAVVIRSARGVAVGYLDRDHASGVGSKIDRGYDVRAIVECIKDVDLPGATLGLVLLICMEGDDPVLADDEYADWLPRAA